MIRLKDSDRAYFQEIWKQVDRKMSEVALRSYDKIPYTSIEGVHDDKKEGTLVWWTNGFWGGLMWIMYLQTGREIYRDVAVNAEKTLRRAFSQNVVDLHHDVGFMWNITSGVHYRLDGDKDAMNDMLLAASILASRFNIKGGYIRAWNKGIGEEDNEGWTIIDCMMNVPLLYHATELTGHRGYAYIAKAHAEKTMTHHVREDGSVRHIVSYNPENGAFVEELAGQGYGKGSSWSRGQGWALYGFVLNYLYSRDERFLETAKKVAAYFTDCVNEEEKGLTLCDFRAPKEPVVYDSTAGCIAACGLIELSNIVEGEEQTFYLNAAIQILKAVTKNMVDFSPNTDSLVLYGTESYGHGEHMPIIYGDYFYIEAVYKLINEKDGDFLPW